MNGVVVRVYYMGYVGRLGHLLYDTSAAVISLMKY